MSDAVGSDAFVRAAERTWETVGGGIRRQILGHGADLMMVAVDFELGAVGTLHRHPHRQVTYVARGTFDVIIDGEQKTLGPGDSFYVAADLDHGVRAVTAGTLIDVFTPARNDFLRSA